MATWGELAQFWVTAVAAAGTVSAAGITYFLFRSETDPQVIVHVMSDATRMGIILLVVENIGKGVAKNVRFRLSRPIPLHAFDGKPVDPMNRGPLVQGIPELAPGAKRVITWGQYNGLLAAIGPTPILVTATDSDTRVPWADEELSTDSWLEVSSFEGTDISDSNYPRHIARHLETLATGVRRLTSGDVVIRVKIDELPEERID